MPYSDYQESITYRTIGLHLLGQVCVCLRHPFAFSHLQRVPSPSSPLL